MLESQNILAMTTSTKQAEIDSAQNAVDTPNAQLDTAQFRDDYCCAIEQPSDEPIIRQEPDAVYRHRSAPMQRCTNARNPGGAALFEVSSDGIARCNLRRVVLLGGRTTLGGHFPEICTAAKWLCAVTPTELAE